MKRDSGGQTKQARKKERFMSNTGRLAGKTTIITGGARGMGEAHARRFVAEGAKVVLTDILTEQGEALAKELGADALFVPHDVSDPEAWDDVVRQTESTFGDISILVNNAAMSIEALIEHQTVEVFRKTFEVNQLSVFIGMKAVLASMRRAGSGSIVNISSLAGIVGGPNAVAYAATKFALRGMTKVAAIEFGKDKIRVNTVHPGAIRTPMLMDQPNFEELQKYGSMSPLGRLGEAEEVTSLVLYLASDEASFCTGAEFIVDGGATAI